MTAFPAETKRVLALFPSGPLTWTPNAFQVYEDTQALIKAARKAFPSSKLMRRHANGFSQIVIETDIETGPRFGPRYQYITYWHAALRAATVEEMQLALPGIADRAQAELQPIIDQVKHKMADEA